MDWVSNSEKSRWFLVLRLKRAPGDYLNKLLRAANATALQFEQAPLYKAALERNVSDHPGVELTIQRERPLRDIRDHETDLSANFHISIAWSLDGPQANETTDLVGTSSVVNIAASFAVVKVKTGNNIHSIPLQAAQRDSQGYLGG